MTILTTRPDDSIRPISYAFVLDLRKPPDWLEGPASAVLEDLQGAQPIAGIAVFAAPIDHLNGLTVGIAEGLTPDEPLSQLDDDLDPDDHTDYGAGNWGPRSLTGPELLALVADILQEDLAETFAGWGQARPPCPHHPHPARPGVRDGEAWWICERNDEVLYRIGRGEVPTRWVSPPSWRKTQSRGAEKRRRPRRRMG